MPLKRLSLATLAGTDDPRVRLPVYPNLALAPGVVHLGLGAFHRAHQAMVFDSLLQRGDPRWSVFAVAMRSTHWAQTLSAQDGLYSVQVSSTNERYWQVTRAIRGTCVAAYEPERVAAAIAAASTRWVTLTVTEKGYTPELAALLVRGLAQRCEVAVPGLTIASCDNLLGNGDLLAALCRQAATAPALRRWIDTQCTFPNSMVDRIVPAATALCQDEAAQILGVTDQAALATEAFWEWVLEDRLADPSDAAVLRSAGVTVVADVRPFEAAKLRMLNGSHSALACLGAVLGLATVAECVAQPDIRIFLHRLMTREVMPNLVRPDLAAYRDALLTRFANPTLRHSVHQIAADFSKKIPQRWVPAVLAQLKREGSIEHLAFVAAVWVRYCLGEDVNGRRYDLNDPFADALQTKARAHRDDEAAGAQALLSIPSIWGEELSGEPRWLLRVTEWLVRIRSCGVAAAMQGLVAAP